MKPHHSTTGQSSINLSEMLASLITDIVHNCDTFSHIDPAHLHVCISSNRKGSGGATFGKLVPLRFRDGEEIVRYRGRYYSMPRVERDGKRILYLIYFYSPRFFDMPIREKLRVVFHELYHISPDFNGDIRRLGKRKASHGHSKKKFDLLFEREMMEFFQNHISDMHHTFLDMDCNTLFSCHSRVYSNRMKVPKPVILDKKNKDPETMTLPGRDAASG